MYLSFWFILLIIQEIFYYNEDKIIILSFILVIYLLYKTSHEMIYKDLFQNSILIKNEIYYYEYKIKYMSLLLKVLHKAFRDLKIILKVKNNLNWIEKFLFRDFFKINKNFFNFLLKNV